MIKFRPEYNAMAEKFKPETISEVVREEILTAPGYYDKGLDALDAQMRKTMEIVSFLSKHLPDSAQVELAKMLGYVPEGSVDAEE